MSESIGLPSEGLSRTSVEAFGDGVELSLGVDADVGLLRQVLTQQAVGVLVLDAERGSMRLPVVTGWRQSGQSVRVKRLAGGSGRLWRGPHLGWLAVKRKRVVAGPHGLAPVDERWATVRVFDYGPVRFGGATREALDNYLWSTAEAEG